MVKSLEDCYRFADLRSDSGDQEAAEITNFAADTAADYLKKLRRLAWSCREKSSAKRSAALQIVLMELEAVGESLAQFPPRER